MIFFCTYCSAAKRDDPGLLPAIERYLDQRIRDLAARADAEGAGFLILSGEYGLLQADEPIPWYDHLLLAEEVEVLAGRAKDQLLAHGTTSLVFHTVDPVVDPQVRPYLNTIAGACSRAGVDLKIVVI